MNIRLLFPVRPMTDAAFLATVFLVNIPTANISASERNDKDQYTLFNPTPRDLMREMSTDRPDLTESPFTVDAGHFQVEVDVLNYAYDRHNSEREQTRVETVNIGTINLKAGLCNRVDLQLVLEPYTSIRIHNRATDTVEKHRGFGDTTARIKANVWGNDGGATAMALMPFVKFPSNQDDIGNNAVEGGLIVPFAVELPRGFGMGLMTELDIIEDSDGSGYHPEFINTITFSRAIASDLSGYIEFFSLVSEEDGALWIGSVDCGFTYGLTKDIQLDAGINIGVTRSADDFNPFVGMSWRF
jgi:hypothetical protein